MEYVEIKLLIDPPSQNTSEILLAKMSLSEFDSFVELENGIKAYIDKVKYIEKDLQSIIEELPAELGNISFTKQIIKQQNWNAEWEKNFEPTLINDICVIRAPFHDKFKELKYNILIEPKMAFGTGHHATTYMMLEHLLNIDLKEKRVLDMGSGTGVLSILSSLKGADLVYAVDNDKWAYNNCVENLELNNIVNVIAIEGDAESIKDQYFDIVLANINRNTLINDMKTYTRVLKSNGKLIMSGFYVDDIHAVEQEANAYDLFLKNYLEKDEWASVIFSEK